MTTPTVTIDPASGWTVVWFKYDGADREVIRLSPNTAVSLARDIRKLNRKKCPCDQGWTYDSQKRGWNELT